MLHYLETRHAQARRLFARFCPLHNPKHGANGQPQASVIAVVVRVAKRIWSIVRLNKESQTDETNEVVSNIWSLELGRLGQPKQFQYSLRSERFPRYQL